MYQETGILTPTPPFDFDKTLQFLGFFGPTKNEQRVSSHTLTKAICIDGQTVVFQLASTGRIEDPKLEYTLFSAQPITEATKDTVVDRVNFFLSLDDHTWSEEGIHILAVTTGGPLRTPYRVLCKDQQESNKDGHEGDTTTLQDLTAEERTAYVILQGKI